MVSLIGLQLPILVGGAVIMENIFNLPGLGRLLLDALQNRDYPVVQGTNLFFATGVVLLNLLIDLIYPYLDLPRTRSALRDTQLGWHAQPGRASIHGDGAMAGSLAWFLPDDYRLQSKHVRRRHEGSARPEAEGRWQSRCRSRRVGLREPAWGCTVTWLFARRCASRRAPAVFDALTVRK